MWYTKENMNDVCPHGSQRRKCIHCESIWQDKRIEELEAKLADERLNVQQIHDEKELLLADNDQLRAEVERLRDALNKALPILEGQIYHASTRYEHQPNDVYATALEALRNEQGWQA